MAINGKNQKIRKEIVLFLDPEKIEQYAKNYDAANHIPRPEPLKQKPFIPLIGLIWMGLIAAALTGWLVWLIWG